ncbi:YhfG family protein [Edaphovirga cremea]|uniref:YhfG family protein n=1 Tax=Edaphovirga cremea TaxID=2267246 RepID=UPI000DEEE9E5|nr:YhfG family protein [Edaphovirga cremea]
MAKKMTLKQKEKLFQQRQNQNFKASTALDGFEVEEVALDAEQALQRLAELRAHYEQ